MGREIEDPYFWMRDDERKDRQIITHLNRENKYFADKTRHLHSLRDEIYEEFRSHLKETDEQVNRTN